MVSGIRVVFVTCVCVSVCVPRCTRRRTQRLITFETVIHRKKKNSVLMPTTQCSEEKMFCGLSPPSAVAVVATVVMMGGGTVTDATASLSASISVASCRAACLHVVSVPLHSSLRLPQVLAILTRSWSATRAVAH